MTVLPALPNAKPVPTLLGRLARDSSGNTLAMIAAAVVPLLAMVGGGIDMSRSYLSQTRLQQACDAGVLAARKKLGSTVVVDGIVPADVADVGNRFFNLNFQAGAYGTENRSFTMAVEQGTAISGIATVAVPTTIMAIFGYDDVPIEVNCEAKLNFSNTDIMFVLDTTGSMLETNPGDKETRIESLRSVVKSFHGQVETSKGAGTRVRYGFVPYATNVNVGGVLQEDWLVDNWTYQSREPKYLGESEKSYYFYNFDILKDGTSNFAYKAASCPLDSVVTAFGPTTTVSSNPHEYWYISTLDGDDVWNCVANDIGSFDVSGIRYKNHQIKSTYKFAEKKTTKDYTYTYKPMTFDVSAIKSGTGSNTLPNGSITTDKLFRPADDGTPSVNGLWYAGCIEERDTYEIDDYNNVDFSRALDLDIDLVPAPGNPATQWRPQFSSMIFDRALGWDGSGSFSPAEVDAGWDYLAPGWTEYAACPGPARKLAEMTAGDVANYVDTLPAAGHTYHDIGMIWGGRLLSPSGLFAAENGDIDGKATARHLIFLTDGETQPMDVSYSAYGVEPLDQRRWNPSSTLSLTDTVEQRFGVACAEVKKRNITVWVIGFGTKLNPIMTECAGPGKSFEASDTAELQDIFSRIAASIGDLRISK